MMTLFRNTACALAALLILTAQIRPAGAGDGRKAFERGDYAAALQVWRPYAEQGSARAQYNISMMFENGLGVQQDARLALGWLTRAAEGGHPLAQKRLARMYDRGGEVRKDLKTAHKWYLSSARSGDSRSQRRLGFMYAAGQGVRQDVARAYMWFKIAAHAGDQSAERSLEQLAADMTPDIITRGEKLASVWFDNRRAID